MYSTVDMRDIVRGQTLLCVILEIATRGRYCQEYQRAEHARVQIDQRADVGLIATQKKKNQFLNRALLKKHVLFIHLFENKTTAIRM